MVHTHIQTHTKVDVSAPRFLCVCTQGQRCLDLKPATQQEEALKWKRIEGYWEMLLCKEVFQVVRVNSVNLTLWIVSFHVSSSTVSCPCALYLRPLSSLSDAHADSLAVINFCLLHSLRGEIFFFSAVHNTCGGHRKSAGGEAVGWGEKHFLLNHQVIILTRCCGR